MVGLGICYEKKPLANSEKPVLVSSEWLQESLFLRSSFVVEYLFPRDN